MSYRAATGSTPESTPSGGIFDPRASEIKTLVQAAGGQTGEIQISLGWKNTNDLDLHVIDPDGEEVFFDNPRSRSKGELDVDQNRSCGRVTNSPVENVFWAKENALEGTYVVFVNHYQNCGGTDPTGFDVLVKIGDDEERLTGSIRFGDARQQVHRFEYPLPPPPPTVPETTTKRGLPILPVVFGWALFGAIVGCGQGLTRRSAAALRNTSIGGAVGGAIGGVALIVVVMMLAAAFTPSGPPSSHEGWFGRLIGFVILGACIGLWIVLIERALSAALMVASGRFEGREIFLDKPEMRLGRNEVLEVYLGGDPDIVSHHANLHRDGGAHVIAAVDGPVTVNGSRVDRQQLRNGDTICLGNTRLQYRYKNAPQSDDGQAVEATPPTNLAASPPPPPPPGKKPAASGGKASEREAPARPMETPDAPQPKATQKLKPRGSQGPPPPPPGKRKA